MALTLTSLWGLEANGNDSVGSNNLTNNNSVTFVSGKIGNAAHFSSASSQYLSLASGASIQAGNIAFGFAAWVKMTDIVTFGTAAIISKDSGVSGQREYLLYYTGASERFVLAVFKATDSAVQAVSAVAVTSATYFYINAWHDDVLDTVNISVNDETVVSQATGGSLQAASAAQFRIGGRSNSGSELYLDGDVDQPIYFKSVPTAGERTWLYNSGSGRTDAEIIAGMGVTPLVGAAALVGYGGRLDLGIKTPTAV